MSCFSLDQAQRYLKKKTKETFRGHDVLDLIYSFSMNVIRFQMLKLT